MSVKLYFKNEIRRFPLGLAVNKQGQVSYEGLMAKVRSLYENLGQEKLASFALYWKDAENDYITIATNDDLNEALRSRKDDVMRVYLFDGTEGEQAVDAQSTCGSVMEEAELLPRDNQSQAVDPPQAINQQQAADGQQEPPTNEEKVTPPSQPAVDESLHAHVTCDGCNGQVKGYRFKCIICPDYDLCFDCEQKHIHDNHPALRISSPKDKSWKAFFHCARVMGPGATGNRRCPYAQHSFGAAGIGQIIEQMQQCAINQTNVANEAVLSQIGSVVSNILKSFGVDADYTVEANPGAQQQPEPKKEEAKAAVVVDPSGGAPDSGDGQAQAHAQAHQDQMVTSAEEKKKPTEEAPQDWEMLDSVHVPPSSLYPSASATIVGDDLDSMVKTALVHMKAMGFTNIGGKLERLVNQKRGDISGVLDALQPYKR